MFIKVTRCNKDGSEESVIRVNVDKITSYGVPCDDSMRNGVVCFIADVDIFQYTKESPEEIDELIYQANLQEMREANKICQEMTGNIKLFDI